ncbi:MAG: hypothetical protein RMJ19_06080 [Gemmatales bacterium]|nr:hypothetical protein [Gemmatales bacterium]MCS7160022.1 hypothetical protein [Gemmatales bacterium]MDW8175221.1 hypothetical protein [Gemmatales bacterium]MDW8221383.1 hypothetical protein [Gemmatales bacterium]
MAQQLMPVSYIVFGILHVIFGFLGLFCGGIVGLRQPQFRVGPAEGQVDLWQIMVQANPEIATWWTVSTVFGLVVSIILVMAGILLLAGSYKGAILSLVYSIIRIVTAVAELAFSFLKLLPALEDAVIQALPNAPAAERNIALLIFKLALALSGVATLIYPLVVLAFCMAWLRSLGQATAQEWQEHSLEADGERDWPK